MYLNSRQLEQLLRDTGAATLPFGARLTPMAMDFVRSRNLTIQYADPSEPKPKQTVAPAATATTTNGSGNAIGGNGSGKTLWWSGTPSGTAKAALSMVAREANVQPLAVLEDGTKAVAAVRALASAVKDGSASAGILVVEHACAATVLANRVPHLRAVVATSIAAIDTGVREMAANVLVVEPAAHSMMTLKNALLRFVRAPRTLSPDLERELAELARGGAA